MPSVLVFICSNIIGYTLFKFLSHPGSSVKRRLPYVRIKWVQVMPNVRIHVRGKVICLHHWINLSIVLVISFVVSQGILDSFFAKGILLGGIVQGFTYSDWKKIVAKQLT